MICDKWLHIYGNKLGTGVNCEWVDDVRENVKGKWICWYEEIKHDGCTEYIPHCKCSECGTEYDSHTVKFKQFCPNCGADMRDKL